MGRNRDPGRHPVNAAERAAFMELLAQPTAPFREQRVAQYLSAIPGVPMFRDPLGNLVVGVGSESDYRRLLDRAGDEPLRLLIAHMDHPGFHGVRWTGSGLLEARWHGGGPVRRLKGAAVWLADAAGREFDTGCVMEAELDVGGRMPSHLVIRPLQGRPLRCPARAVYGGWTFRAPVWRQGHKVYARAVDDLAGVFAAFTAVREARRRTTVPAVALLTRAEEVGFVGAIGHFELGWLGAARRPVVAVSLEASRTLPGALIGKGPVVRLGDRRTVFSAAPLEHLSMLARRVLPGAHQRRVMDCGSCEGTAASVYGLPVMALSVPLGNYHNQGLEGGPDCRGPYAPAPEFVHESDVAGLLALCRGLLRRGVLAADPWAALRGQYRRRLAHYQRLL